MCALIKTGYFRMEGAYNSLMSYAEYYDRGKAFAEHLRSLQESGELSLYCACKPENNLALGVTKSGVIRVLKNLQQEQHALSCPKSEHYTSWVKENEMGIDSNEDTALCFNITIPTGKKSTSTQKTGADRTSSGQAGKSESYTSLLTMTTTVNCFALEKQGYSIKKELGQARREGREPSWQYKSVEEFNRLFFGVANEVNIQNGGVVSPLYTICYKPDVFYQADYRYKFYMYAVIDKVHEIKPYRKYQYLTVQMYSNKGKRTSIRVETERFEQLFADIDMDSPYPKILAGYIRHDTYPAEDGSTNEWATLLKGCVITTNHYGIYAENILVAQLLDALCERRILFKRPYLPLENYGGNIPTILIERLRYKHIIIDFCKSSINYSQKESMCTDNPEYEVILFKKDTSVDDVLARLSELMGTEI